MGPKVHPKPADTDASFRLEYVMSAVPRRLSLFVARLGDRFRFRLAQPSRLAGLGRLSVAQKLRASLLICGLGLFAVAVVYGWTRHDNERAAEAFAAHQQEAARAATLATEIADARRLQTRYASTFEDADREALQAAQQRLQTTLAHLQRDPHDAGSAGALRELAVRAGDFAEGITALNARVDEMGRGDAGLRAQLEAAAATLEASVESSASPVLMALLQKMRREESLLLLTGDSAHTDRASEQKLPFDLALAQARLGADTQDALRTQMDDYQGALLAYTAARIGLDVEAQSLAETRRGHWRRHVSDRPRGPAPWGSCSH